MKGIQTLRLFTLYIGLNVLLLTPKATAFFDELTEVQQELQMWEQMQTTDLSDVLFQLDAILVPVFYDVQNTDWFHEYISALAQWGIVSGYRDINGRTTGQFHPENNVTVAEVLKMAMESAQVDVPDCIASSYNRQEQEHWANDYVTCAENIGVRLFTSDHSLDLNSPATRSEVLTIIHDVFGDHVLALFAPYRDVEDHVYEADIGYATFVGLVQGDSNAAGDQTGFFRPDDPINRAEVAKILYQKLILEMLDAS